MTERPQIKFALLPQVVSKTKHIAKCAVTHIPPVITDAMKRFEKAFTEVVDSMYSVYEAYDDVTYTLFGGALRDFIIAAISDNDDDDVPNINDFDIRIIFPDDISQANINRFMTKLCAELVRRDPGGTVTQESQIGDERLRSIVKIEGVADYDISFRSKNDLSCTDEKELDLFLSENRNRYSLAKLASPEWHDSMARSSVKLTSSDFVAIDRVESASAAISAVAMSREGSIWISSLFVHDIGDKCITQARDGERHVKYCRDLHKRKFPGFSHLIEGDEDAFRTHFGDGTSV